MSKWMDQKAIDTTIIYYTDNTLEKHFEEKVQDYLINASDGKKIISVSQKPMSFGDNICVGDIGRSHHSLFYQTLIGAEAAKTRYIALAEHDCLYTKEHFNWIPPSDNIFYYNVNQWLVQWNNKIAGQYSYFRRKCMSQLICNRELYIHAVKDRLILLENGYIIKKGKLGACEPGVCDNRVAFIRNKAELAKFKDIGKQEKFKAMGFRTTIPNLDIRHGDNFSGNRRANKKCYSIPYWGSFHKVMGKVPPGRWYQEAVINEIGMTVSRKKDTSEKRWNNLIKPLIPYKKGENRMFIELGCNAGFYCRKMADLGYKSIGIEKEVEFIRHACFWESCDPRGVKIIEGDINNYEIPCSSIVLIANVHYWLTTLELNTLIKKLREKSLYVIVVGRHNPSPKHKSPCDSEFLKISFSGWEIKDIRYGIKHYSIIFKNPDLIEKDVNEIFPFQQLSNSKRFLPSFEKFIRLVLSERKFNPLKTDYYKYLKWRKFDDIKSIIKKHINLIVNIKQNGITKVLEIGRIVNGKYEKDRLVDGDHRYIIAKTVGIKKIICKINK